MSNLFHSGSKPQVLAIASHATGEEYEPGVPVHLYYIKPYCSLQTLLRNDPAQPLVDESSDEDSSDEKDPDGAAGKAKLRPVRVHAELQHPELEHSAVLFDRKRDLLWLGDGEDDGHEIAAMAEHYGAQLHAIRAVILPELTWGVYPENCLQDLKHFAGVRTVYVWLESYRFSPGARITTEEEYRDAAEKLQRRDMLLCRGRNFSVEYIDDAGNVHGGFWANGIN